MKQFASWFTHGIPGGATLRREIFEARRAAEVMDRVEAFFAERAEVGPQGGSADADSEAHGAHPGSLPEPEMDCDTAPCAWG
jgi:hypothetical protein